jgi:6-phosphogluconolactonase
MTVHVYDDFEALARAAAARLLDAVRAGARHLLLAGGTTPIRVYELLAAAAGPDDTARMHLFFGDERAVPPEHPDSNFGMIRRAWLEPGRVPPDRVHRIRGELDADRAARLAEEELRTVTGEPPVLDLALLGLGADGHTASLFPWSSALVETQRLFAPAREGRRITATYPLLNRCSTAMFLVSGAAKADAVRSALRDAPGVVPASLVQPARGPAIWLLDREAASGLD